MIPNIIPVLQAGISHIEYILISYEKGLGGRRDGPSPSFPARPKMKAQKYYLKNRSINPLSILACLASCLCGN